MSSEESLVYLLTVIQQLNRSVPIVQLIFGTFGNVMNILIFTRRSLDTNPCSFYFLASSINNLFVLYVALLTRFLSSGWSIDPSNINASLCKIRIFFVYSSLCLIQWIVVLASLDRFFSTCQPIRFRHLSQKRFAQRFLFLTISIVGLAHFHTLIWWNVDVIDGQLYCNIFSNAYEIAFQVFFLLFSCLLPPILMTIFGLLTIYNIRQIAPQHARFRSKNRQLVTMLLFQVVITIFCTAPFTIVNLFDMILKENSLIIYSATLKTFFEGFCRLILYFNPVIGFYIYSLTSRTFRAELQSIFRQNTRRMSECLVYLCQRAFRPK